MADYINPPGQPEGRRGRAELKKPRAQREARFPERPEKDVLLFLIEHAPLKNWQRDILSIVRDEAYYFYPQAQTKIIERRLGDLTGIQHHHDPKSIRSLRR